MKALAILSITAFILGSCGDLPLEEEAKDEGETALSQASCRFEAIPTSEEFGSKSFSLCLEFRGLEDASSLEASSPYSSFSTASTRKVPLVDSGGGRLKTIALNSSQIRREVQYEKGGNSPSSQKSEIHLAGMPGCKTDVEASESQLRDHKTSQD